MSQPRKAYDPQGHQAGIVLDNGPYIGVVMANNDSLFTGRLQVWIPEFGGDPGQPNDAGSQKSWRTVSWASPYYGISNPQGKPAGTLSQSNTQSYGMWMPMPDIGTRVLVVFVNGDVSRGYWIASIPEIAHGSIPAYAQGKSGKIEDEFNPISNEAYTAADITGVQRPENQKISGTYKTQGLDQDKVRGPVDSSSYRETPSKVFGFDTPGGHSFIMDDGGSKVCRLRSAAGHQVIMNDATGTLYIVNAGGTAWFELSATGQVDIFGAAGINLASKGPINIHSDAAVSIHSGSTLKMVGTAALKLSTAALSLFGKTVTMEGVDSFSIHSCKKIILTSFEDMYIKVYKTYAFFAKCVSSKSLLPSKKQPEEASQVAAEKPSTVSGYQTTVARAPAHEPYKEHDNGSGGGGNGGANNPTGNPLQDPNAVLAMSGLNGNAIAVAPTADGVPKIVSTQIASR